MAPSAIRIGIQAAHEQVNPRDLLHDVKVMDDSGVEVCWSSDHYMPWWHTGASGAAAWPWLGAALAHTSKIKIGTAVTAPILRYNPAVVAQVFATLDYMFPGRTFLSVGTGESLNEVPSGNHWPSAAERLEMLKEAMQLIKKLWSEDWVDFEGQYYSVKRSNLYTKPATKMPLYVAALGRQAARLAGAEGDGLLTNESNPQLVKERIFLAFEEGARKVGKNPDSMLKALFLPASYDEDRQKALKSVSFWKGAMIKAFYEVDYPDPRKIEESGQVVGDDTMMDRTAMVITDAEEGIKKLQRYADLGFTDIVLINSSPDRTRFTRLLAERIIPALGGPATTKTAQAS
jgi:G6PDH family F420-dependent oxidoreductase